ncbi:hypothetical protein PT974_02505 [Cladobotryum mycophilum]|uniref:VWFA domain-containing protein n=1 Tax=Cladobotryum mycophilum TaxID=491253 RepID=A0ABR0SYB5_9HYPO
MKKSLLGSIKERMTRDKSPSGRGSEPSLATRGLASNNPFSDSMAINENEPPPAYSPVSPMQQQIPVIVPPGSALSHITNDEDKYAFLASFDTIFVIDDSGSMTGASWRETEAALRAITPICTSHDADGIDLYFLNHRSSSRGSGEKASGGYYNINSPSTVERIFRDIRPYGITPTGGRLQSILKPYVSHLSHAKDMDKVKPVNIIVITDGRPTDDPESIIVQSAKKLDQLEAPPHQVGIQFFQVGNERGAREALRELDDDLSEQGIRDMVDAVTWDTMTPLSDKVLSADGILKVVLGAVIRRLDRKPTGILPGGHR